MADLPTPSATPSSGMAALAPLHARLDEAYPETLRQFAEVLYAQLVEDDPRPAGQPTAPERLDALALLALRQAGRLSADMGGISWYMPKGIYYHASRRDQQMYEAYKGGKTYRALAQEYSLTVERIRQICAALLAQERAQRQGKLELV
jgi:Mor family transcriptional regulator